MKMKLAGGGWVSGTKIEKIDGIEVGIVEGYIASKKLETGRFPDQFRGANVFGESIQDHKNRGDRSITLNFMHIRSAIGHFPIDLIKEDERGLFGVAHINLELVKGREVHSLARQKAIRDFSIGWDAKDEDVTFETLDGVDVRVIHRAQIFEGSLVDEPMNRDSQVTAVKADDLITIEQLKDMTEREMEAILHTAGLFSRKAILALISAQKSMVRVDRPDDVLSDVLAELQATSASL